MNTHQKISIADSLAMTDILTDGTFDYTAVIDARTSENGKARPIEECTLKRLQNRFIKYQQLPTQFKTAEEKQEQSLLGEVNNATGKTLLITDDVAGAASFCERSNVSFTSKILYVVETGKGYSVRNIKPEPMSLPRFGTFGG